MSRRYSRSERYGRTRSRWLLGVAIVALVATTVVPAASYTSADVDRSVNADVVADPNGVVGQAAENPRIGKTDTLTVLTNRFGTPIDVTVRLRNGSEVIADIDGDTTPNERTVTLSSQESDSIPICVYKDATDGETIYFEFEISGQGITGSTTELRSTTAYQQGKGKGNPGTGGGNQGNGWCKL